MSMEQLTIIQFVVVFCIYTGLTVLLPAMLLYPKISYCRAATRFFVYFTVGNFYLMNLVYVLELCHISCWLTLVLGTVLPAGILYVKTHDLSLRARLHASGVRLNRIMKGSYGVKSWLRRSLRRLLFSAGGGVRFVLHSLRVHALDVLFAAVVAVVVFGYYGPNLIKHFGYCASDVTVHNYWINYLGKNQIFVNGVYPFGFHNIVYYIHAVFRIDTYVILRVFWLVQTFWIHMVLLMFLKAVCRSRFLPYGGVMIYVIGGYHDGCYWRYCASLPQEFGMLFILPAVYFAFGFFWIKKEELKGKREKNVSKWYLVGFALNFAMTLSVHFYGTIILGFFCVGIACGYAWRFLQPKYFIKVVKTCIIGLVIALLPMVIAYLSGTKLEGSLRWAMGVMAPAEEPEEEEKQYDENGIPIGAPIVELEDGTLAYEDTLPNGAKVYYPLENQELSQEEKDALIDEYETGLQVEEEQSQPEVTWQERLTEFGEVLKEKLKSAAGKIDYAVALCQFEESAKSMRYLIYLCMLAMPVLTLLLLFLRRFDEAFSLVSVNVNVMLLMLMLAASDLGLPTVMQQSRICIYLSYMMIVLWVLTADRALYAVLGVWRPKWMHRLMNTASFAVSVAACVLIVQLGWLKPEMSLEAFQTNEAITCLTNIIHEETDLSWTIVSAYDELQLGLDHGYHEELVTFLKKMEYTGGISMFTLPSKTVYFFIEKKPIDYLPSDENSGQMISKQGAANPLPESNGFENYKGENRWILMSRFYEWAQVFQKQHPYDMTVYFENENFVCYKLVQNDYHLFNLSIDYGYNMR